MPTYTSFGKRQDCCSLCKLVARRPSVCTFCNNVVRRGTNGGFNYVVASLVASRRIHTAVAASERLRTPTSLHPLMSGHNTVPDRGGDSPRSTSWEYYRTPTPCMDSVRHSPSPARGATCAESVLKLDLKSNFDEIALTTKLSKCVFHPTFAVVAVVTARSLACARWTSNDQLGS